VRETVSEKVIQVGEADYAFWFCLKFDLTSSVFVFLLSFVE